jgi:hypothetical protein
MASSAVLISEEDMGGAPVSSLLVKAGIVTGEFEFI